MAIARSLKGLFCGLILTAALGMPALAEKAPPAPLAEIWTQTSTEYRALCYQTYKWAEMQFDGWAGVLQKRADGRAYRVGSTKPVAIVLDLDETVIDNSGFQAFCAKRGVGFDDDLWNAWVEFQGVNGPAGAIVPGAPEFLRKVEAMGVTPIYISNRTVGYEDETAKVLARHGINVSDISDRMMLRLPSKEETARGEQVMKSHNIDPASPLGVSIAKGEGKKEARRILVKDKYDVVAYFGDQLGDFQAYVAPSGELTAATHKPREARAEEFRKYWGTQYFVLPNPMYGYWGPGQSVPAITPTDALEDYGFEIYVRGRRAPSNP